MNSSTGLIRTANWVQGVILVACSWLAVVASGALIGPILPTMAGHFSAVPGVAWKIDNVATLPALAVALLAMPLGMLADRIGHWRVLASAALLYGALGIAPYFLNDLDQIVASRAVVGIAEAAVMTCSYALLGAYFVSPARERWYALTTGTAPLIAFVSIQLGGGLGESDWHRVFMVYSFALLLFVLILLFLWEPGRAFSTQTPVDKSSAAASAGVFSWRRLMIICGISVFAMTAFLITVIQTGFLMTERGISSAAEIGFWQSIGSLANPAGALLFGVLGWRYITKLGVAFSLMAAGFAYMSLRGEWQAIIWGGAIANLGCGMLLPTIVSWGLQDIPAAVRGRGAGLLMASNFFGQYLSPLAITALMGASASRSSAVFVYAAACAIAAVVALMVASMARKLRGL